MESSLILSSIYNAIFHIVLLSFFGALFSRQSRRGPVISQNFLDRDFLGAMMTLQFVGITFYTRWWSNTLVQFHGSEDGMALLGLMNIIVFPFVFFIWLTAFFELEKFQNIPTIPGIMKKQYGKGASFITWVLVLIFGFMMLMEKIDMIVHVNRAGENYLTFKRKGLDIFFQLVKMGSFALEFPLFLAYLFSTANIFNILLPKSKKPLISTQTRFKFIVAIIGILAISLKMTNWWPNIQIIRPLYFYFFSVLAVPFLSILWGFKVDNKSFYLATFTFLLVFFSALAFAFLKERDLIATSIAHFKADQPSTLLQYAKIGNIWGTITAGILFLIHHYIANKKLAWTENIN